MSRRCPSAAAIERGFWSGDHGVRDHVASCEQGCRAVWTEIEELAALAAADHQPSTSPSSREELRTAIVAGTRSAPPAPVRRRLGYVAAGAIAAAAAVAMVGLAGGDDDQRAAAELQRRGAVRAHPGAEVISHSAGPDEIVRLVDGTITVHVEPLASGERFRVITGDAEIEVVGTVFDVISASDRLVDVRVSSGVVVVRSDREGERTVRAGERWQTVAASRIAPATPTSGSLSVDGSPASLDAAPPPHEGVRGQAPAAVDPAGRPSSPGKARAYRAYDAGAAAATAAPDPGRADYEAGWRSLRAGQFADAARALERATASARDDELAADAGYWRAVALARADQPARARAAFEQFLRLHTSSIRVGEVRVILGWMAVDAGQLERAESLFRAAARDRSARVRAGAAEGLERIRR